jgi:hypothetical protein
MSRQEVTERNGNGTVHTVRAPRFVAVAGSWQP